MIQIITSFNQRYYDLIGKDSVASFLKYWSRELSLTCYVEEFKMSTRSKRINQIDFSELDPDYARYQADTTLRPSDKKFAKKAYSFMHAMNHSTADWIVWLDADVITAKKMPLSVLTNLLLPEYLSMYMGVTYDTSKDGKPGNWLCPETGIFAVNTRHGRIDHFRDEYCRRYHERDYQDLRRFYDNDVFGAALNVARPLKVNDLCTVFQKGYKTPLRHTVLGEYLIHHKAKHSKAEYSKSDVADVSVDSDRVTDSQDQLGDQ
jgi:hypothetical protein